MFRRPMTPLVVLALAWIGSASCSSDAEPATEGEDTTSGPATTMSPEETGSESSTTMPVSTTDETEGGHDGPGSINCGPQVCTEGLLCVREVTHDELGEPHSEWFCRSKPEACGDGPGDCACAMVVCYNDPCACQDTGLDRFTCTNDGTCEPGDTTEGDSTETGQGTDAAEDTTGGASSTTD